MIFHPVYAGPAVRFKRYLPGFQKRGIQVRVCTATPDSVKGPASGVDNAWSALPYGTLLPLEMVDGVPVQRVRLPDKVGIRREAWFARAVAAFCSRTPHRPDVVQLFSARLAAVPGLWRLRRLGIPAVVTRTMVPLLPRHPVKRALLGASIRFLSSIVVSSEMMAAHLRTFGVETRIEVIPNGVDIRRFRPPAGPEERSAIRRQLSLPEDATVLLFAGPIAPRKGIDLLLEAWCRLAPLHPRVHLVVAGPRLDVARPAWASYNEKLEALADRSGARDRLHFPGLVQNVEDYMRAADMFVFTSSREGMPNVVPEAMASGLPVVTVPFIGLPQEFGEPGRHFVLTAFDPDRLAADISGMLGAPRRRVELGRQARAWVEARLDVNHSLDRYARLYDDLSRPDGGRSR
jgi:glycosyltransferase involved in cell wall biosynthesis